METVNNKTLEKLKYELVRDGIVTYETLEKAETMYFSKYNSADVDTTEILNFCMDAEWRQRDIDIGGYIMEAIMLEFFKDHPEPCELYVLKETDTDFRIYHKLGFEIVRPCNGFSVDDRELPCFFLRKESSIS